MLLHFDRSDREEVAGDEVGGDDAVNHPCVADSLGRVAIPGAHRRRTSAGVRFAGGCVELGAEGQEPHVLRRVNKVFPTELAVGIALQQAFIDHELGQLAAQLHLDHQVREAGRADSVVVVLEAQQAVGHQLECIETRGVFALEAFHVLHELFALFGLHQGVNSQFRQQAARAERSSIPGVGVGDADAHFAQALVWIGYPSGRLSGQLPGVLPGQRVTRLDQLLVIFAVSDLDIRVGQHLDGEAQLRVIGDIIPLGGADVGADRLDAQQVFHQHDGEFAPGEVVLIGAATRRAS